MQKLLRRILEKISRGVVLKRNLPAQFEGLTMLVTPEASLCYWKAFSSNNWDDLFRFADGYVKEGDIVYDVGANLGVFAVCAAIRTGPTGRVYAFEPDPVISSLLQRTKEMHPGRLDHLLVIPVGVSNHNGFSVLQVPERARACSHLSEAKGGAGTELMGKVRQKIQVPLVTLDSKIGEYGLPDVLKIDVDGVEQLVIEGSRQLFQQASPRVLIEVSDRNQQELTAFFHSKKYSLYNFDDSSKPQQAIPSTVYNTLALPNK